MRTTIVCSTYIMQKLTGTNLQFTRQYALIFLNCRRFPRDSPFGNVPFPRKAGVEQLLSLDSRFTVLLAVEALDMR